MQIEYIIPIYGCVVLALVWTLIHTFGIIRIKVAADRVKAENKKKYFDETVDAEAKHMIIKDKLSMVRSIGQKIQNGAYTFLIQEYKVMLVFVVIFSVVVICAVDIWGINHLAPKFRAYATIAFIIGSLTSMLCGWIGMAIAVKANFKTAFMATDSIQEAFKVAYRAG